MENRMKELNMAEMENVTGGDNHRIGKMDDSLPDMIGDLISSLFG